MESVVEHGSSSISMTIVGHKSDLEEERTVTSEEGRKVGHTHLGGVVEMHFFLGV